MQPTTAPVLDDGAPAAGADTTPGRRPVIARAAAALMLLAVALGLSAGALMLTAPSASVTGEVVAFGGGGNECHPTVAYEVDGRAYRFTPGEGRSDGRAHRRGRDGGAGAARSARWRAPRNVRRLDHRR